MAKYKATCIVTIDFDVEFELPDGLDDDVVFDIACEKAWEQTQKIPKIKDWWDWDVFEDIKKVE